MLYPLAVWEEHEMRRDLPNRATGRSDPHKGALMGPAHGHTTHDCIPLGHQLLDREVQVGKSGPQHQDHLTHRFGTTIIHARWNLVIDAVGCDQLVYGGQVAVGEHFRIRPAELRLVWLFWCLHVIDCFSSASYT